MKEVVILGGGVIGLSSALYLHRAGHRVTVLDKARFTDNCSYGNLGYVCPSHFIPLAAPGIVKQGIKWMFNSRSPFYVQPSLNRSLVDWGLKFMRSATEKNVAEAAVPLRDIALFSQRAYDALAAEAAFSDIGLERKGLLEIFQTAKVADHAAHTVETGKRLGLDVDLLDRAALAAMEPHTEINARGAIFFRCDGHLSPDRLMEALKRYLKNAGVALVGEEAAGFEKSGRRIAGVLTRSGRRFAADEIVVAAGSWSRELAAMLDVNIPLMPGRGYSFTVGQPAFRLNHPAILTEGRVAITPLDNGARMRYGGTMEIVPTTQPPRYARVEGIVGAVNNFFPKSELQLPRPEEIWFGYRPASADGLPYIGRVRSFQNVTIATGHSMLGLSLGAGTGKLVSELVAETEPGMDLSPFAVERF